jgi:hypothetical protein
LKVKQQVDSSLLIQAVAGSAMEGASMMFHGDYKKRCLLKILVSQILLLVKLISEIKYLPLQKNFSLQWWQQWDKNLLFPKDRQVCTKVFPK